MKPPFEVTEQFYWTRPKTLDCWILASKTQHDPVANCRCEKCKEGKPGYVATAFKDDFTPAQFGLNKQRFAEFAKKHGIDANF